jgi:hypothetical protein
VWTFAGGLANAALSEATRGEGKLNAGRGVARLVGIGCGVVSGVINLKSSGVEAPAWTRQQPGRQQLDS